MIDADDLDRIVQDLMNAHDAMDATVQPLALGGAAILLENGQLFMVSEDLEVTGKSMRELCDCPEGARIIDGTLYLPEYEPDCIIHGDESLYALREQALEAC